MPNPIIKVNNLSKRYRIGAKEQGYKTFREAIVDGITAPVRNLAKLRRLTKFKDNPSSNDEEDVIWALKDVSFEVNEGEVLGIIGRNGAGKSTLLKILSRITEPTSGYIDIHGRISSLLEVGTGFHPELTGRENIFLNGAILGMRKREIEEKFDEIVKFAEIEKFIDTPVKRYSSGMYVRLAFAVAAHLEPEILVVDEVLAVGDADFQRKCLGKMGEVAKGGRTVIFVSHNMGAISELCQRTVLLREGKIIEDGPTKQVVGKYLSGMQQTTGKFDLTNPSLRWQAMPDSRFKWNRAMVLNSEGKPASQIRLREPFSVILQGVAIAPIRDLEICFAVYSGLGFALFNSCQRDSKLSSEYPAGTISFNVQFSPNLFGPGQYWLDIFATAPNAIDYIRTAVQFSVLSVDEVSDSCIRANYGGVILYPCIWSAEASN